MLAQMISTMKARIAANVAELETLTQDSTTPSQAFIVTTPDCSLAYSFEKVQSVNWKVAPVGDLSAAPRFSRKEANHLAQFCNDNRDNKVIAVSLVEALEKNIESLEITIKMMESTTK